MCRPIFAPVNGSWCLPVTLTYESESSEAMVSAVAMGQIAERESSLAGDSMGGLLCGSDLR